MREFRAKRPTAVKENEALFIFEFVRLSGPTQDSLVAFCRGELFVLVAVRASPSKGSVQQGSLDQADQRGTVRGGDLMCLRKYSSFDRKPKVVHLNERTPNS